MWKRLLSRHSRGTRNARAAAREALVADVANAVLDRLAATLSLDLTTKEGHPNTSRLNEIVRNVDLLSLNVKSFGYDLARTLAPAATGQDHPPSSLIGLRSKPSTQADMQSDWAAHWCAELQVPVILSRKLWEYCFVLQALHEAGLLTTGKRGLGFGCGQEPIPSYLAARGVAVTVTDQAAAAAQASGWADTGQHAAGADQSFKPHIVDRAAFDRLVSFETVDMTLIPVELTGYDFCWSICAMEHLGSLDAGMRFVERSLGTVRPGGLSIHTTEYNMRSDGPTIDDWPTVLYQRHHLTALADRLRSHGHDVAELDFDAGDGPMDRFIDLPPWGADLPHDFARWHRQGAHLKLAIDGFPATCFGLLVRRSSVQ